jgi:PAT family beta-lactamase induction signal transducer AmpG
MNEIEAVGAEAVAGLSGDPVAVDPKDRPWLFGLLIAPSGAVANGVVQGGVLAYLLQQQGVGSGGQSHLIALLGIPTWLYFAWSPVTDFFVKRRTWLLAGGLLAAVMMGLAFHQPHLSSRACVVLMFVSACCSQLVVSSCGGMMGAMQSEGSRRVAGSFYQAGSMGIGALAAWVLVWESKRVSHDVLGLTAAGLIGIPALFSWAAPKQEAIAAGTLAATFERMWREFKETFWRVEALPYIGCMTFPMASGAAVGLLPGVANQFHVGGDSVAWMNGLAGGLLVAAGSGVMVWVRVRMRASVLYMVVSLINCLALAVLWLGPLGAMTYYTGVTLYLFTVGACYAMFTAVVLEFLGDSGKSGSTRYSIINSLGNLPVQYMVLVDGWGGEKWGGRGLAGIEAVVGAVGALILLAILLWMRPGRKIAPVAGV